MSILFESMKIGSLEIKNRFVNSATYECMAEDSGEATEEMVKRYRNLAKGGIGLIIPGYLYVHPWGRAVNGQAGIHGDDMIPGLKKVVDAVHEEGAKIAFQLVHAGRQTTKAVIGRAPIGPSSVGRDPTNFVKPREMGEEDIQAVIQAFSKAAGRAADAGADAVQIHAAHGYLINQFISPFFNQRTDDWGGSDESRYRFLKEVLSEMKKAVPETMPILIKLNTNDFTSKEGVTPSLAAKYAEWLKADGIDGVEVSCGTVAYFIMNMARGDVPVKEVVRSLPWWKKPYGKLAFNSMVGKFDLEQGYNLEAAKTIKPVLGDIPLMLVGGLRRKEQMEEVLEKNHADFISMCRPFIREPYLVKKIKEGKADTAACESCNKCLAAVLNSLPVRCYYKGLPN